MTKQVDWPLYSCDDHLDMWALPLDLWTSRLPAADGERAPRVVDRNGVPTWVVGDSVLGISGLPTSGAHGALARGGYTDGLRPSKPDMRLVDMDRDGLYVSVIYGPAVLGLPIDDNEFKAACWRAWNDFAIEFNSYDPKRLSVLPVLPTHSPEAAAAELERVAASGHRGALMYCFEFDCGDPAWDRVWAASAETGLPISFHIGGGVSTIPINPNGWAHLAFSTVVAMQLCEPLATMIFCGALERHPGMRLVMAEAGLGWLPYFVHRMDASSAKRPGVAKDYQLRAAPSDIFRQQVYITFEEEAHGSTYIELLGADNFMWASDFPHADSTFPESRASIVASFESLSDEDCRKITADNCRKLYKFDWNERTMPVAGFDHIALPTANGERFLAFYKSIGFTSPEEEEWRGGRYPIFSLAFGNNKINVHPEGFTANLRGPTAVPGCGDICFVWEGGLASVLDMLANAGIPIIKGPVDRIGGRDAGTATSVSVYVRDPDDNLVEFMCYGEPAVGEQ